eukprot:TRINITY_DN5054_c2_g1_i1.p1 TRINITY_DN5054_c2_g1~~TRINITY_DN5054_c2_g1_i1.p1  ORF type:complete len:405 (+),score=220.41 TRINITY_DN5054_c2_g1_i1:85-1215(+)
MVAGRQGDSSSEGEGHEQSAAMAELQRLADPLRVQKFINALPKQVRDRTRALQGMQHTHNTHFTEMLKEKAAIRAKYEALWAPLFAERKAYISGEKVATAEEIQKGIAFMEKKAEATMDEEEKKEAKEKPKFECAPAAADAAKGIPEFWVTAMRNCTHIGSEIEEHDEPALKHLTNIECSALDAPADGFILKFHFSQNEFFENSVLTKMYQFAERKFPGEEETNEIEKCEGCEIKWHPGKNLTVKTEKKKQKKASGKTKVVTKTLPQDSFFRFFMPPHRPGSDDEDSDEEEDDIEDRMEHDFQLGSAFRDSLIPHAVEWFCDELGDDDDDDEEEEEEEGEESEEEEPSPVKSGKKGAGAKKGGGGGGKDQQDCKQQ